MNCFTKPAHLSNEPVYRIPSQKFTSKGLLTLVNNVPTVVYPNGNVLKKNNVESFWFWNEHKAVQASRKAGDLYFIAKVN